MGKVSLSFPPSSQKITFQLNPNTSIFHLQPGAECCTAFLLVFLFVCLFILPSSRKIFHFNICSLALSVVLLVYLFVCSVVLFVCFVSENTSEYFTLICSLALSLVLLAAAMFATYSYANHRNKYDRF